MSDAQYPIRKPATVPRAIETARKMLAVLRGSMMGATIAALTLGTLFRAATDEWRPVRDGQWSRWIVSIWTHWQRLLAAGKHKRTGRSYLAASRKLSLTYCF